MPVERLPGVQLGTQAGGAPTEQTEEDVKRGILLTTMDKAVSWARKQSTFPLTFGLACCAIEMMAAGGPHYDLARWGMDSPLTSDASRRPFPERTVPSTGTRSPGMVSTRSPGERAAERR